MNIADAKVLVTGGGTGIGREIARTLAERGAKVAICGRRKAPIEEAVAEFGGLAIQGDVGVAADAARMGKAAIDGLGGLNVLINNAGHGGGGPLTEMRVEDFDAVWATNVRGAMLMAQACARHMVEADQGGSIVNIGSTSAHRGGAGGSAYCASKFALTGMTECWRAELRRHDIRVMQINPSEVLTDFYATAGKSQEPNPTKLRASEIAHMVVAVLEMDDRGFTTELTVFATNPR